MGSLKRKIAALLLLALMLTAGCRFTETEPETSESYEFAVHFIDVGQGDSVLVECGGEFMLIDSGEAEYARTVMDFLEDRGADRLSYLMVTHPHSDHMGGMPEIISADELEMEKIIMPDAANNTALFENMLLAVRDRGLKITAPEPGDSYQLGEAEFTILGPVSDEYSSLNNYSVGIRLCYGDVSFVLTGDAEEFAEKEMLGTGLELDADIIKAGHHGSSTSGCEEFLKAVSPSAAVISVGEGNKYGHPSDEILRRYAQLGAEVYRTDTEGNITIYEEDGHLYLTSEKNGTKELEKNSSPDLSTGEMTVYKTASGKKYHLGSCSYLGENKIEISLSEALREGLEPCSRCSPPAA